MLNELEGAGIPANLDSDWHLGFLTLVSDKYSKNLIAFCSGFDANLYQHRSYSPPSMGRGLCAPLRRSFLRLVPIWRQ